MLATIGEDAYDPEHRHADHLSRTAHAQSEAVEVDIDHVEVGERARPPRLQPVLQRGDDTRHSALREGRVLEQRLEGSANPTGVAARQVRGDHRFIHLRHASLIARDDRRRPFLRASDVEEGGAGYGERDRPRGSRQRPRLGAVAIAPSDSIALVRTRPESGPQFLVHGRLNRGATWWWISSLSEMGSSSCAPTDLLVRFLTARSSGGRLPGRPAGRALHQPEECAIFLFPHEWGRHLAVVDVKTRNHCSYGQSLQRNVSLLLFSGLDVLFALG